MGSEAGRERDAGQRDHRRARRLAWFVALYLLSLAVMALVVWGIRMLIPRG